LTLDTRAALPLPVGSVELPPAPRPDPPVRAVPLWVLSVGGALLVGALLAARHSLVGHSAALATFGIVFASIVIEALPFILLGAIVAAAAAVFIPERAVEGFGRLPGWLQLPSAALAGVAFPLCECGSVPVGRRLIARGVHPAAGLAFMFAAPILNPIVILSTWVAYGGGGRGAEMVGGRCGLGLLIAIALGWVAGRDAEGLRARCAVSAAEHHDEHPATGRGGRFVSHLVSDFMTMGGLLVLGAALSAGLQAAIPQNVISGVAGTFLVGTLALMAMAFVLSLCSEADAFVAISFTAFPRAAQLGFLLLGPFADMKLSVLYGAQFGTRFVARILPAVVVLVIAASLLFGAVT
jgi:uncharacterized protein